MQKYATWPDVIGASNCFNSKQIDSQFPAPRRSANPVRHRSEPTITPDRDRNRARLKSAREPGDRALLGCGGVNELFHFEVDAFSVSSTLNLTLFIGEQLTLRILLPDGGQERLATVNKRQYRVLSQASHRRNQWVLDDSTAQLRMKLVTSSAASQLSTGYLISQNPNSAQRGNYRASGFELRLV